MEIKKTFESFITEASRRKVHKAAKEGSYPAVIVVVKDGKVIHQEPVSSPEVAPATFNVMQKEYPNALLHLEDKTGKRLFSESVITEADQLKKGDIVKFKDGSSIHIIGPKGDGYDYKDGREKGHHPKGWFDMMISSGKAVVESVVNEMDSEGIQSLADELSAEVYTSRLKNGAKSANNMATTTTKTWDDGAPVLKYLARGKAKSMPFTLYQRPFTVLHDVAHGWFYFTDGRKWYGLHGDDGYDEPGDLPFDMEISESVVSEATDINDPVLIRMRQAQMHANNMKKLDAMKKAAEKEARRNRPRWTQKKYDQWLDTVASNGGAENAFDMAKNAEFEPGLIDWVEKNFRGDDPLQRIQWDIEALAESYNDDDINMVYGFYGTVADNSNEKNAKKLFDQGIKDLKKKYRLTEEESLEVLNSKMGRKAADQIYDGQAKTAVEGLETYYGKTLHKELAEIQKSMVFDSTVTEAKAFTRAEVMDFLENHLKFVRTSEEFDGVEGGIWTTAENGETMGSFPIFDYYSTSSKYEFGVLNKFAKKLSKMGWYCEYYDPGTVMIWPI